MMFWQTIWVPIIYVFFPETKGRELEDFDRLFAGEEDVSIAERESGVANAEYLERNDLETLKGGAVHEEEGLKGLV